MKIVAVSRENSDQTGVALVVDPPVTPRLFEEFQRLATVSDAVKFSVQLRDGHLIVRSDVYTPELRSMLERLLMDAHDIVSGAEDRRRAERDAADRELALLSAAAGFDLPIV